MSDRRKRLRACERDGVAMKPIHNSRPPRIANDQCSFVVDGIAIVRDWKMRSRIHGCVPRHLSGNF
jgi:hypothetical protein